MRPLRRYSKHFRDVALYEVDAADWLASIESAIGSVDVDVPVGLTVSENIVGSVVELTVGGGQAGKTYRIGIEFTATNDLRKYVEIMVKVIGRATAIVEAEPVTLISGSTPTVGTAIARAGSSWTYECLLVADAPGAMATVQIRVGNTPDAATDFGPPLTVAVSSTPSADGKYRGTAIDEGNQPWAYHAADIESISGTNAVVSVTGVGV